jgi:hypothetical protein
MDEVAIYRGALSGERVLAHYNAGTAIPEASTVTLLSLGLAALAVARGRRRRAGR